MRTHSPGILTGSPAAFVYEKHGIFLLRLGFFSHHQLHTDMQTLIYMRVPGHTHRVTPYSYKHTLNCYHNHLDTYHSPKDTNRCTQGDETLHRDQRTWPTGKDGNAV
jgi:hypothetical protein